MKTIRIPENSDKYMELADITEYVNGIILVYKDNVAVGYITYSSNDSCWNFLDVINVTDTPIEEEEFLIDVVRNILRRKLADDFKLVEFNQTDNDQKR